MDSPSNPPKIALCPRCFCLLNVRQCYRVDFCLPVRPPLPLVVPINHVLADPHPVSNHTTHSSPLSASQQSDPPALPPQYSRNPELAGHEEDHTTHDGSRRTSASSSSSLDSAFTEFSINTEFAVELQAAETYHFSQQPFQATLPPPQPSSPSTDLPLTPSTLDEPPSTARRWVVFRGRIPGVYTSS